MNASARPPGLPGLAGALADLARRPGADPDRADDAAHAAGTAVALLRDTMRAQPEAGRKRLGWALVILAQSRLANGDIEAATAAAVAAGDFVALDGTSAEVRRLADFG